MAQKESGFVNVVPVEAWQKPFIGSYGLVVQTLKLILPYPGFLCAHIPFPINAPRVQLTAFYYLSFILLIVAGILLWMYRNNRLLIFGIGFYLAFFAIVQFFPVGNIMMAERYTHVSQFG